MINTNNISINSAIIHRLNNKEVDGLDMSDFILDLNDDFKSVLASHSKNSLEDKKVRYAKFNNFASNNVYNLSKTYFSGAVDFVTFSHDIAKALFLSMSNKSISAADVVVSDMNIDGERYLAFLKLDYKNQYLSKVDHIAGKKKITLEKKDNAWPEAGTRLQKAAFVRFDIDLQDSHKFDLVMLDRQNTQKSFSDNSFSLFFSTYFLNASLIEDENTNTTAFIKGAKALKEESKALGITAERALQIYDHALNLIGTADKININSFTELFFDPEDGYEKEYKMVKDIFQAAGLSRNEFNKSQEIAETFIRHRKIQLDGVKLVIDNNTYSDPDKFIYKENMLADGKVTVDITIKGLELKKME